jgi:hypothetical protein
LTIRGHFYTSFNKLLELASTFDTLISDEEAVFNPADYNDRLLLGLKGTISEAELHQIK